MFAFTTRQIEVFLAVCEAGSFRRAADTLGMSEAAISSHMRLLEEQLDCMLFERRRGSSIGMTDTGRAFREDALVFVKTGLDLGRRGRAPPAAAVTLRFYVGDHILEDYVRPALPAFLQKNPDLDFTFMRVDSRDEVSRAVLSGDLDGALVAVASEADLPRSELVSEDGSGIYGRREMQRIVETEGLSALGYLISAFNVGGFGAHERALRRWGVRRVRVAARYPYHDVGVRMAIRGVGAIMTLDTIIQTFDPERELVRLVKTDTWQRRLYIAPTMEPERSRRVRDFLLGTLTKPQAAATA